MVAVAREIFFVPDDESAMELDELRGLDLRSLDELYRAGTTPALTELDGRLRGHLLELAVGPTQRGLARTAFLALVRSAATLWKGKAFRPTSETTAEGFNLVGSFRTERHDAPFHASVRPSRFGSMEAVELDYGRRNNPAPIRWVRDELRKVGPNLYLGQAYLTLGRRDRLLFYFALTR